MNHLAAAACLAVAFTASPAPAAEPPVPTELRELRLEMAEADQALDHRLDSIEFGKNLILGLLGLNLLAIPIAYWRLVKRADQIAERKLTEVIESRPEALRRLIDERDAEIALRRTTPIGVVSNRLKLEGILTAHDFRNVKTFSLEQATDEALAELGAVVLDLDGGLDDDAAIALIERQHLENALAFTAERRTSLIGRCAFANMPVTLYGRLLELLKFRQAAEPG